MSAPPEQFLLSPHEDFFMGKLMITGILRKFTAIFDRTIAVLFFMAGVVIVYQMLSVAANTMSAYLFNFTVTGVEAFAEFGLLFIVFLGTAWVLRNERHVVMDIMIRRLSKRMQTVFLIITSTICIGICIIIAIYGTQVAWDHWGRNISDDMKLIGFPKAVPLAIIPIGSFMLVIQFARRIYGALHSKEVLEPGAKVKIDTETL